MSTKQGIWSYNQNRHSPPYQGWTKQPSRRKRISNTGIRIRDNSCYHCYESHKNSWLNNQKIRAEDVGQTHPGSLIVGSVSVRPYELWFVGYMDCILMACLTLLASTILMPLLLKVTASAPISCWMRLLWWVRQVPVYEYSRATLGTGSLTFFCQACLFLS